MNSNESMAPAVITVINPSTESNNKIFVTVNGEDLQRNLADIGLSFDSSEQEILEAINPIVQEVFNIDLRGNGRNSWLYKVRKATNTNNIYVIPNSTAG